MPNKKLIPDSSFFICFFDDLKEFLDKSIRYEVVNNVVKKYSVEVTPSVCEEVNFKSRCFDFSDSINFISRDKLGSSSLPVEPLRLVLGRGEFEVISVSYGYKTTGDNAFIFILDDGTARKKVTVLLPLLLNNMMGTIGFIQALEKQHIVSTKDAIDILDCIKESNFRVKEVTLDSIRSDIAGRLKG